jgi:hypothetical protein
MSGKPILHSYWLVGTLPCDEWTCQDDGAGDLKGTSGQEKKGRRQEAKESSDARHGKMGYTAEGSPIQNAPLNRLQ